MQYLENCKSMFYHDIFLISTFYKNGNPLIAYHYHLTITTNRQTGMHRSFTTNEIYRKSFQFFDSTYNENKLNLFIFLLYTLNPLVEYHKLFFYQGCKKD